MQAASRVQHQQARRPAPGVPRQLSAPARSVSNRSRTSACAQATLRLFGRPRLAQASYDIRQLKRSAISQLATSGPSIAFKGVHHVALLCENLERSLAFYQGVLGLEINPDRPHSKLPYRGEWLWIGPEMIHLMELPNPDPLQGRPEHGGRDRHFCIGVEDIKPLVAKLEAAGVTFTQSASGRPAVFFRDPDMNCLEVVQVDMWR